MKKELLSQFKNEFTKVKKDLQFKASFDELEEIFYLNDFIQAEGYVSTRLHRTLARRVSNLFWNWNNYLHGIIMPNPNSMISVSESQMFGEQERAEIIAVMNKIMAHVSKNTMYGLSPNAKAEGKFLDDSVAFWKSDVEPLLITVMRKVGREWERKALEPQKQKSRHP